MKNRENTDNKEKDMDRQIEKMEKLNTIVHIAGIILWITLICSFMNDSNSIALGISTIAVSILIYTIFMYLLYKKKG